jgi:molybdopterin converting factor subunit 1
MKVKTWFFASARDAVGQRELDLEVPDGLTAGDLLRRLVSDYPKLAGCAPSIRLAVNEEYASATQALANGDEVALIPPVSGG